MNAEDRQRLYLQVVFLSYSLITVVTRIRIGVFRVSLSYPCLESDSRPLSGMTEGFSEAIARITHLAVTAVTVPFTLGVMLQKKKEMSLNLLYGIRFVVLI